MDSPGDVYDRVTRDYEPGKIYEVDATCTMASEYINTLRDEVDMVNEPPHYNHGNIECIEYIKDIFTEEEYRGYLRGNITKYHHRLMHKGSAKQNAEKMKWYLERLIEVL